MSAAWRGARDAWPPQAGRTGHRRTGWPPPLPSAVACPGAWHGTRRPCAIDLQDVEQNRLCGRVRANGALQRSQAPNCMGSHADTGHPRRGGQTPLAVFKFGANEAGDRSARTAKSDFAGALPWLRRLTGSVAATSTHWCAGARSCAPKCKLQTSTNLSGARLSARFAHPAKSHAAKKSMRGVGAGPRRGAAVEFRPAPWGVALGVAARTTLAQGMAVVALRQVDPASAVGEPRRPVRRVPRLFSKPAAFDV